MKKILTIDDFMVAFVSALGYGFGEKVAKLLGFPLPVCVISSMVLGVVLESVVHKIAYSKEVQKKPINRAITYVSIILIFLLAQYIAIWGMGVDMMDYVMEQLVWVIGLPVAGFFVNMLIREYRIRRIKKRYGDGSDGYVFQVNSKQIERLNRQNEPIRGSYDDECAVKTRTGIYVGEKLKKVISYCGIPYAKAPAGERRWKAPEPLDASDQVYEAKYFGASAIQVEHKGSILKHHRQSEDCLYLNVCVSVQKEDGPKPVIVLFHHGDFSYGGSVDPLLDAEEFVKDHPEIVLVSFNYRLGIFGFIDFSAVPGGEAYPDALNLGLMDQLAALQWIKENIAAFGGDANRITAVGFDAGASSICLLAASGKMKGLIQKAYIFDGHPAGAYDSRKTPQLIAQKLLDETHATTMEELAGLDADTLKAAAQKLWRNNMCAPTCDGTWLPADGYLACRDGAAEGIEFIIGFPGNEMQVQRAIFGEENYEAFVNAAVADMQEYLDPAVVDDVKAYIEEQTKRSSELDAKSKLIEQWNALSIYRLSVMLSRAGNKVHMIYWEKAPLIENLGSGSVDAAASLLGNNDAAQMYGSMVNDDQSEMLQVLLMKFINGESLELYPNEIKGIDGFKWKAFPQALIVSDEEVACAGIEDKITAVKSLLLLAIG